MLLVFLMAAIVAIMLYREVPRIAFETQRQKEQMLIERGEQYKRSVQLFLRANNNQRWPASLDELESFNGRRFLRRRYKDPMTGKDQWRLVHIQNGVLTDSVNNKPGAKPGDQKSSQQALAAQTVSDYGNSVGTYNAAQAGAAALNAAQRRRTSDSGVPGGSPFPGAGAAGSGTATSPDATGTAGQPVPGQAGLPAGLPGLPGLPGQVPGAPPIQPFPGQLPGQTNAANQSGSQSGGSTVGDYSSVGAGGPPGLQPAQYPGMPGLPPGAQNYGGPPVGAQNYGGPPVGAQNYGGPPLGAQNYGGPPLGAQNYGGPPLGAQNYGGPPLGAQNYGGPPASSQNYGGVPAYPIAPGAQGSSPGYPQPGMSMNPGQTSAAANLLNTLLTTARPGGLAGVGGQNTVIGGGIAGVASTADGDSIMVYHDHSNYSEWEFVFDPAKAKYPPPNPVGGAIGTPAGQLGSMQGSTPGTPAGQLGNMPGSTPGTQGVQANSPFGAPAVTPDIRGGNQ